MKFRTKLIFGFSIVIFFISAILGVVSYNFNSRRLSEKAAQSLKFYSRQTAANVDFTVDSMKHVTDYILSDPDMLNAMKTLPKYYGSSTYSKTIERNELLDTLNSGISMYYINSNFYRVIIFNEFGDVASSTNTGSKITNKARNTTTIDWLDSAARRHGKPILVAPHMDGWGIRESEEVFSLARKVQGGDFGYIEVQYATEELKDIFEVPDSDIKVVAFLPGGHVLYRSEGLPDELVRYIKKHPAVTKMDSITVSSDASMWTSASEVSGNYGIRVVALEEKTEIVAGMKDALMIALGMAVGCFVISMGVVIFIASKLSRPLTALKDQMENTGIENLDAELKVPATDDEVQAVGIAYQNFQYPNIYHAVNGNTYYIAGHPCLVVGGAASIDKEYRQMMGWYWTEHEVISLQDMNNILHQIHTRHFDFVFTHTIPTPYIPTDLFIKGVDQSKADRRMEDFLVRVKKEITYDKWYCGHWHANRKNAGPNIDILFDEVEQII